MRTAILSASLLLVLTALALLLRREAPRWFGRQVRVMGEVTAFRSQALRASGEARLYAPVYRFTGEDGTLHTVEGQVYGPTRSPTEGSTVSLSYPAGRPELARKREPMLLVAVLVLLYAGGVLVGLLAG